MKEPMIFVRHMLESMRKIEHSLKGCNKKDFLQNVDKQDASVRRLEIIGEAAKNLSLHFRKEYPTIPWRDIAGMRDKLIHHYFGVKLERVWVVVKKDLPKPKKQILNILQERE
jgi:uncharacterized protein with HEPN domain